MSSLQVDSISSMGGGHVDGAGKVVQCVYHQWDDITTTTSDVFSPAAGSKISFTPKFANSLLVIIYDLSLAAEWVSGVIQAGVASKISHDGTVIQDVTTSYELYTNAVVASLTVGAVVHARQTKINSVAAGSTSARDIELQFAAYRPNTQLVKVNKGANYSNLLVQEIAQ
jgi:hypothetical protein